MFRFRKDHPYRPVHWRWERARILTELGFQAPGHQHDDKWIKSAANFRRLKNLCKDELAIYRLCEKYPDIAMAYELWDEQSIESSGRPNPARYEIEARFLAREDIEKIAYKAQLTVETLQWYERLFFNVSDRLTNRMYIMHTVIGDGIQRGMSDRDYAVLWKLYAYVRGSAMLDFLITTFADWSRPTHDGVLSSLSDDHRVTMKRKSALAARTMGINGHTQERLLEIYTKIVEIEKSVGIEQTSEGYTNNIQVMLAQLPLLVGQQVTDDTKVVTAYSNIAAGLRSDELLAISMGKEPDKKSLEEHKFPEPLNGKEIK